MFQFPRFASAPYVFRCGYHGSGGFPHSEIPGSKSVCRLPEAYRRLQRPSSPSAAKASTRCTFMLDHITQRARTNALLSGEPAEQAHVVSYCCRVGSTFAKLERFARFPARRGLLPEATGRHKSPRHFLINSLLVGGDRQAATRVVNSTESFSAEGRNFRNNNAATYL